MSFTNHLSNAVGLTAHLGGVSVASTHPTFSSYLREVLTQVFRDLIDVKRVSHLTIPSMRRTGLTVETVPMRDPENTNFAVRTIICKGCHKEVTGRMHPEQEYCSHDCFATSPKPERRTGKEFPCAVCGKMIYIRAHQQGKEHYFCSTEHHNEWQGRNKTTHTCKVCKNSFQWSPSRTASGKFNILYCSIKCRDADPTRREMLLNMNIQQQTMKMSKIERIGYSILNEFRVDYFPQYLIGKKFLVDAFIPGNDLVIQFDGDYWHGNPEKFPCPEPKQIKRIHMDKSQDAYMVACGYRVFRFWEHIILKQPDHVREVLRTALALPEPIPFLSVLDLLES